MSNTRFNYLFVMVTLSVLSLVNDPVSASENWSDRVTVRGFLSAVYQQTDQDNAVYEGEFLEGGITSEGTSQGSRFGLNINARISDRLRIVSQFFSGREEEGYNTSIDWAFVSLDLSENFDLRAGRLKFPGGLVSEFADTGYTYPWILPPREVYSEDIGASQSVHESFSGVSLLWSHNTGNMTYSANIFGGEVVEHDVLRTGFSGVTLEVNWDDKVTVQLGSNTSTMETDGAMPPMDGQDHDVLQAALKIDWNNLVVYGEWAEVDMGDFKFGESEVSYLTLGYRFGRFLPHFTVSQLEKAQDTTGGMMMGKVLLPYEQSTTTAGVRWDFMSDVALKLEVSRIDLDSIDPLTSGYGLFGGMPDDDSVNRYGISIDAIF